MDFHKIDGMLKIKKSMGYGVSAAIAKGEEITTYCSGSGRYGQDFPVNRDMLFQSASVSKPAFALTLLRYVDKGLIDLDEDISGVLSDFVHSPVTFKALLSHTAGFNVHGFDGYRADHKVLTLEDVIAGRGNSPKVEQTMPYEKQYSYSGGGTTLAQLAFTRITGVTLRDAFAQEVASPLGLTRSGYFQPLDEDKIANAAFGGKLGIHENHCRGYHYYPEQAAAGLWTTPTELTKIGLALSQSVRHGGLLKKKTAERMMQPILDNYGLSVRSYGNGVMGHDGWNEGFLTTWRFSVEEDLAVAVMINRADVPTHKRLAKVQAELFQKAKA